MQSRRDPVGDSEAEQRDTRSPPSGQRLPLRAGRLKLWLEQSRVFPSGETARQWITGTEPTAQDVERATRPSDPYAARLPPSSTLRRRNAFPLRTKMTGHSLRSPQPAQPHRLADQISQKRFKSLPRDIASQATRQQTTPKRSTSGTSPATATTVTSHSHATKKATRSPPFRDSPP